MSQATARALWGSRPLLPVAWLEEQGRICRQTRVPAPTQCGQRPPGGKPLQPVSSPLAELRCLSRRSGADSSDATAEVQPWHTPGQGTQRGGTWKLSADSSFLKGIIHGLVTAYREGQGSVVVPSPSASSQNHDSPATGLCQGDLVTRYLPRPLASGLGSPALTSHGPDQGCLWVPSAQA